MKTTVEKLEVFRQFDVLQLAEGGAFGAPSVKLR